MGPRSHERGNLPLNWPQLRSVRLSFNGAAFSRTRKLTLGHPPNGVTPELQWGRVLTNAETRHRSRAIVAMNRASMGPRSHERGNRLEAVLLAAFGANLLQWGRVLTNAETSSSPCSRNGTGLQWGRVLTNAETRERFKGYQAWRALQWGRVLTNAETKSGERGRRGIEKASMGPRSHERGNERIQIVLVGDHQASMGPRSHERGNSAFQIDTVNLC